MATQRDAAEDRAAVRWEQGRNKEGSKGGGGGWGKDPQFCAAAAEESRRKGISSAQWVRSGVMERGG